MTTIHPRALAAVTGGTWRLAAQGSVPLPGGGRIQGGINLATDGAGFGVQGQTPLPWGGRVMGTVQAGNYELPKLPKLPKPTS